MVAVSRFVEFSAVGPTFATGVSTEKESRGTRGFSRGTGLAEGQDTFSIVLNSNDQLAVSINAISAKTITLASGADLDPRFVARDIAFKLHSADSDDAYKFAQCEFRNGYGPLTNAGPNEPDLGFIIWSGKLGKNTVNNDVNVSTPTGRTTAGAALLGFDTNQENLGVDFADDFGSSSFTGDTVVSGVYSGQFDDFYTVMISDGELIENPTANGGNTYLTGMTADGMFVGAANDTYTITISTANGSSMGLGSGNVPSFIVTDTQSDGDGTSVIELLYADHYYDVGSDGVRIKFADAAFGEGDIFTLNAFTASGTGYPKAPGSAKYIWSSSLGDSSKEIGISTITTQNTATQLGTKGVEILWTGATNLDLGERFNVICRGPQTTDSDVTQLNFGNVTVSTNSAVKVVWFELISGAVAMSTVKFSLQADGTFQHHDQGDNDTEFHYGTSGAGNSGAGSGPQSGGQAEFSVDDDSLGNIIATDIDQDSPTPAFLAATVADLAVVNSADNAETVGNFQGAVVSDFIYLAIKLGANETGANSTINYRMFFDFS